MGRMFGNDSGGTGWGKGQTPESPDLQGDGGPAIGGSDSGDAGDRYIRGAKAALGGINNYFQQKQAMANSGRPTQIDVTQAPQLPSNFFQSPQYGQQQEIDPLTGQPVNQRNINSAFYGGR